MKSWVGVIVGVIALVALVSWWTTQQRDSIIVPTSSTAQKQAVLKQEEIDGLAEYCAGSGSRINLRSATRLNSNGIYVPREFTTTNGGEFRLVIKNISADVPMDLGTFSTVRIGRFEGEPTWNKAIAQSALLEFDVREDKYSSFTLDPGTYWLWVSDGGDIDIISCEPNNLSLVEYDE